MHQAAPGIVQASHPELGDHWLHCDGNPELLFTENERNAQRLWGQPNPSAYVKDAFHNYLIAGNRGAVNPNHTATKAGVHYELEIPAGMSKTVCLRLTADPVGDAFHDFDAIFGNRLAEADEFYNRITPKSLNEDERRVHRQALAGMLWTKQLYHFDLERWLVEHKSHPLLEANGQGTRNMEWFHMLRIEYPPTSRKARPLRFRRECRY